MSCYQERYEKVAARVAAACERSHRSPDEVRILPVSKTHPIPELEAALEAGACEFGENRPQELARKAAALANTPHPPRWVQIGSLQRNKAKLIVAHASEFQALDSLRLAQTLSRLLTSAQRELAVMIEVNTSGESAKHGVAPAEASELARQVIDLPGLQLRGMMTVAAPLETAGAEAVRRSFTQLRQLRDDICALPGGDDCRELSMGMSGDFELAIECGATCVRIGTLLFGPRLLPNLTPPEK